jgi:hypothetical protein
MVSWTRSLPRQRFRVDEAGQENTSDLKTKKERTKEKKYDAEIDDNFSNHILGE